MTNGKRQMSTPPPHPLLHTIELDDLCGVENFYSAEGEISYHGGFMVRHAQGSYSYIP